MEESIIKVPGSCGELVQGIINENEFLISCPVEIYSKIYLTLSNKFNGIKIDDSFIKARKAIQQILRYYHKEHLGARVKIESNLLIGKGMGSSTADIVGVIAGVMNTLHQEIDLNLIKKIALSIEPTDGTFLSGINIFDHKTGTKEIYLGDPPAIDILVFSEEGAVDTIDFNQHQGLYELKRQKEPYIKKAVLFIKKGMKKGDKNLIGSGTTISSLVHQNILYKPHLSQIKNKIDKLPGVYGINIAHSGTLIGILVDPELNWENLIKKIKVENPLLEYIARTSLISGGIEIIK